MSPSFGGFCVVPFHLSLVSIICITRLQSTIILAQTKGVLAPFSELIIHTGVACVHVNIPSSQFSSKHEKYRCVINCYSLQDGMEASVIGSVVTRS